MRSRDDSPAALGVVMSKKEFARNLQKLMNERDMTASDLARAAFGEKRKPGGHGTAAKGRDLISNYLRGLTFPEKKTIGKLAQALGVEVSELIPQATRIAMLQNTDLNFNIQVLSDRPGYALVQMHRVVRLETVAKLSAAITEDQRAEDEAQTTKTAPASKK